MTLLAARIRFEVNCCLQVEAALRTTNQTALNAVATYASSSPTDPAWEALGGIHKELVEGHAVAMHRLQVPQASCCSLQAASCFQAGLLTQVLFPTLLVYLLRS